MTSIDNFIPPYVKSRLADILTLSRVIIGLVILALSFLGEEAYMTVVILALIGGATDIFDGKIARHYLSKYGEGKLGKYDLTIDTIFVLCIIGYFTFSGIVIPTAVGMVWIALAILFILLYKRKTKILFLFEIPTILVLIVIAGIYDPSTFFLIILPAILVATIINHRRVLFMLFSYIPRSFRE